ncbi:Respiratory supercomplex factor 2 [Vanrija pseudolonga]|uniref:Respiratory supercomplex factor 2 n=1 Tax=Vanrija pseudolonga TaxID=143232 RepID=A0AAF0YGJ7_9TREE|nr:Respiratory supercomplex factor 2 [Vanrija pseudolonga]
MTSTSTSTRSVTGPGDEGSYIERGGTSQKEYMSTVLTAASKGLALGVAGTLIGNHFLKKRSPAWRAVPMPYKFFVGMMMSIPVGTVFGEKAGEKHIAQQWSGYGKEELDAEAKAAHERWESMSTWDKTKDWAARHQYTIIGGSWVASLGIAFGVVARNKYQTFPQKIVQARMYAQGLTIGVLMVSAVLAGVNAQGKKPELPPDHSWRDMLEQGGQLTKQERINLRAAAKVGKANAKKEDAEPVAAGAEAAA